MSMLASLISYKPRRRTKSYKSPFTIRRPDPLSSPHPYASPEVFNIGDLSIQQSAQSLEEAHAQIHPTNIVDTPGMKLDKLDIEISPPLTDSFPPDFLDGDIHGNGGTKESWKNSSDIGKKDARNDNDSTKPGVDEEAEDSSYSSQDTEEVVANLQAMDASNFVNTPEPDERPPLIHVSPKKPAPAPIKIPDGTFHNPKVQVLRSSVELQSNAQSRPDSQISMSDASAISGATLARALVGNSFMLSNDQRKSRHRSGMVRQDSTTLPRGDHPFLHSPYWRDRKLSGSSAASTSPSGPFQIPPVPPVPAELLNARPTPSRSVSDSHDKSRVPELAKRSSTGSLRSRRASDSETVPSSLERSNSVPPSLTVGLHKLRAISPISEVTSSEGQNGPNSSTGSSFTHSSSRLSENPSKVSDHNPTSSEFSPVPPAEPIPDSQSSSPSVKDLEGVLQYYHSPDPSDHQFSPAFSPITEVLRSQVSSPEALRRDKHDSKRSQSSGKLVLATSSVPSTARGRVDWAHTRNNSDQRFLPHSPRNGNSLRPPLLPIGERPHSVQLSSQGSSGASKPNASTAPTIAALASPGPHGPLTPPPTRGIFNRQRSGSAPSPIKVVRDSKDFTAYNITVSPLADSVTGSTPTTGNSEVAQQTFPETPNAFSPIWSAGLASTSANLPSTPPSSTQASQLTLAQQVLIARAATSVQGARHSRRTSIGRPRMVAKRPDAPSVSLLTPSSESTTPAVDSSTSRMNDEPAQNVSESFEARDESLPVRLDPQVSHAAPHAEETSSPRPRLTFNGSATSHNEADPAGVSSSALLVNHDGNAASAYMGELSASNEVGQAPSDSSSEASSASSRMKPSPRMPSPPPESSTSVTVEAQWSSNQSSSKPLPAYTARAVAADPIPTLTPTVMPVLSSQARQLRMLPPVSRPSVVNSPPPPSHHFPSSPSSDAAALFSSVEIDSETPFSASFGSPPPYYTVVYDRAANDNPTPSTSGSGSDTNYRFGHSISSTGSPMIGEIDMDARYASPTSSSVGHRMRSRPPLPIGPRRPSQQNGRNSSVAVTPRTSSVTSVGGNVPSRRKPYPVMSSSPRFQTPPLKWRGYTMEAAKWTFTSAQLQNIVSRAIRQSSQASSIRLLPLETLDNDIPEEMHRLEMQRTDVKTRYKMLTRRRATLFRRLSSHINGSQVEDAASAMQMVEDLSEASIILDKLAEDLHSIDEQISQLNSLQQIHSASALAMALRKLNASFLRQFAESRALRMQLETLEAERDEAWKQAEDVANELDHLNEKVVSNAPDPSNPRSSRVVAVRKSSLRASKAGFRSSVLRRSQGSSVSSGNRTSVSNLPSTTKSIFPAEGIPPVPRVPRRRPVDIETDLPPRISMGVSTGGPTPTSETRAMMRAQEELYEILGIKMNDASGHHRSRSTGPASDSGTSSRLSNALSQRPRSGRPSSLPGSSELSDVYNVMTANRNAMLVTLGMLSDPS